MKTFGYTALLFLSVFATPANAQNITRDFESVDKSYLQPALPGTANEGSSAEISKARARSGNQSIHLSYRFSKRGNISLNTTEYPVVVRQGNKLRLSVWIYGSGQNDFPSGGGLTLVDAGGETFLYWLGKPLGDALGGTGWQEVAAEIDVMKPTGHWGGKNTGVIQMPLQFLGIGLDHGPDQPAQGEIFIDDLSLTAVDSSAPPPVVVIPPTLTLATTSTKPDFTPPGTLVTVQIRAKNFQNNRQQKAIIADWSAVDFHGTVIASGRTTLDTGGNSTFALTPRGSGIALIRASVKDAEGVVLAQGETQIATYVPSKKALPVTRESLPLLYGVCAHLNGLSEADAERSVQWMKAMGFRACRFDLDWGTVQPEKDIWKWEIYDRLFALMKRYGIEPQPLLAYSTRWAATGNRDSEDYHDWANSPPDPQAFAKFAQEAARRYGAQVRYWEVWNEPDNAFWRGTPQQYAQLFDASYTAIKQVQPNAIVINGGISEVRRPPDFVPKWQAAAQQRPDAFAYHSHASLTGMVQARGYITNALKAKQWTMPVVNNEAGFSSTGNTTERDQAIMLAKKMSYAPALGDTAYYWYDLRNDGNDLSENEHNFGLLRHDFSPKASSVAARTVIGTLSGHQFIRRIEFKDAPQVYALLYGTPDSKSGVVSLWNEGRDAVPLLWSVPGQSRRISLMGNIDSLRPSAGLITTTAGAEPQFIHFVGDPKLFKTIPSPIKSPSQVVVAPGETAELSIMASNPLKQKLTGTLTLSAPSGWRVTPSTLPVTLLAGKSKKIPVRVTAPGKTARSEKLGVRFATSTLSSPLQAHVTLATSVIVPRIATAPTTLGNVADWSSPFVNLGQANRIALYQNAPLDNLLFRGNDDLSARVTLTRVPSGLRVSIRVRDDIHSQNSAPGSEWMGDSVQFALASPTGESYEWTVALTAKGAVAHLDIAPNGVKLGAMTFPMIIRRDEATHETLYDLVFSATLPGGAMLGNTFSSTLLVNDNDGNGRKGWVEWTPGIGRTKDPSQYQPVVVR